MAWTKYPRALSRISWVATKNTAKGLGVVTKIAYRHRRRIYGAVATTGAVTAHSAHSLGRSIYDAYSNVGYSEKRLARERGAIEEQSREYARLTKRARLLPALDSVAVGGDVLRTYALGARPTGEVAEAYRLAYPGEAATLSFTEKVRSLDESQLAGFASGIKGKLFELQYVDWLNKGNLPDGYTAAVAGSAIQPGWDIAISGPDGNVANVLQARATESVSYVAEAIETHPHIDVVTTDEVYSQLVLQGAADSVTSADITNAELSATVASALSDAGYSIGSGIPVISLALIAFTTYTIEDATAQEKARSAGSRIGYSYLAFLAAQGVLVVTQTWWLGVLGGGSVTYLLRRGAVCQGSCPTDSCRL